eukprot:NODE_9_length_47730_cov_0.323718.p10 type:complete len:346 gc:universal NODE_9_length_47730_cov_0.323718:23013-24050(+)
MFNKFKAMAEEKVTEKLSSMNLGSSSSENAKSDSKIEIVTLSEIPKDAKRKALFVGINYFGTKAELRGCINDVKNIREWLEQNYKFDEMKVLTDDNKDDMPTHANMVSAFKWLVKDAKRGDSLFFHFSGHGGFIADKDNDEHDCQDETIIPVDYEKAGQITDDELHELLVVGLPEGVRLTCLFDCCHSGSALDLPFTYLDNGKIEVIVNDSNFQNVAVQSLMQSGLKFISGEKDKAFQELGDNVKLFLKNRDKKGNPSAKEKLASADVIMFSGCRDEQTSADAVLAGRPTGAMTHALIKSLSEHGHNQSFVDLLKNIRINLKGQFTQIPQLSCGKPLDMRSPFSL